jgi:hypothetical protein
MRTFNPHASQSARGLQAWQLLIGMAKHRQTVTREELALLMFRKLAADALAKALGHVSSYCADSSLPPLTAIVVGKIRGIPSDDISIGQPALDEAREKVYAFDWFDLYPPSEDELRVAYERHTQTKSMYAQDRRRA